MTDMTDKPRRSPWVNALGLVAIYVFVLVIIGVVWFTAHMG
jgi:hypothetical protein